MFATRPVQVAGLMVLAAAAGPALAQSGPSLAPGSRIRVEGTFIQREIGTVLAYGNDSLTYVRAGVPDTESVATAGISRLEVSTGQHHRILHDMAMGAMGGLLVGGIVGAVTYQKPDCPSNTSGAWDFCGLFDSGAGGNAAAGGILGAGGGALVGVVVGLAIRSERWRAVALDSHRLHAIVAPAPGGIAVGVRLAM
ncbi:MAG TPA: hypothetical protein VFW89_08140 [Gemmatimonadaceae bacterium]|nr:hypothetical protein [Gemmatimonadaceae bacterium]